MSRFLGDSQRLGYSRVMDSLSAAVSLGRALLALSRARRTGVLTVAGAANTCRIAFVAGVPRAAVCKRDSEPLGDLLLRDGALDQAAHVRALRLGQPCGPVGQWLVTAGAASRPAVEHALRTQLRRRVLTPFGWPDLDYVFVAGAADIGSPHIDEPVRCVELAITALRSQLSAAFAAALAQDLAGVTLQAHSHASALLADTPLWPDEAAMLPLLETGAAVETLRRASAHSERAPRSLAAMVCLGLVHAPQNSAHCGLLLRKLSEARRGAQARELLDLAPAHDASESRRALRRLSSRLHPDTLGPHATPALRRVSTEVMNALVRADCDMRTGAGVSR